MPKADQAWWWTVTKYASQCAKCGGVTPAGGIIAWNHFLQAANCVSCGERHAPRESRKAAAHIAPRDEVPGVPSPREILRKRTPKGAWSRQQLAEWGVPWPPPKGWRRELEHRWEEHRQ